ncbi:hypothetical protein F2Q69_00018913 [Brassica cretica]|uniref:HSF-type DNA-binding domain-containing protein n=1 Tax=Brassica cretica TaxID=69181 RepID=A0A8S9QAI0_BRACR|nr:hypothetical protein F2Q69_00018913 [Brassica cretica]
MEPVQSVPSENSNSPSIPPPVSSVPPFLSKTYEMVDDPSTNEVVSWSSGNNSFVVWNVPEFSKVLLPKHFKHNNFSSFVRQLNTYGFRKVDPDQWEFANEGFLRGQKQLLKGIVRRKPQNQQQTQVKNSSVGACVEVGKFGIEEEVERLKHDKNVLMQELVRLSQQQQATEHQLQNVGQKVQVMEQRQQQTMSFLAKAVQSPGFLNQLVQQNSDCNKHIQGSNKKRRLPGDEEESCGELNRQIVKYQPSLNEAAQTMLGQILNRSSSTRCESVSNNPDSFLLDDAHSTNSAHSTMNQVHEAGLVDHPQAVPSPSQGVAAAASSWSPESELVGFETGDGVCFDPIMAALGGSLEIESDEVSPVGEGEMTELQNEVPKLPGVQDSLWEQFFADEIGEGDDILSGAVENGDMVMEQEPNEWKQQEMNHLSEQMELLSSETRN